MAKLGERFVEIGRGYERVSDAYQRPYILGVDIKDKDKPFVAASGDNHSDFGAVLISLEELLSDKWKAHIQKSNCSDFVERLRISVENGEQFPQDILLEKGNNKLTDNR